MKSARNFARISKILLTLGILILNACGGGGGGNSASTTPTYTLGGSISGLTNSGLVIINGDQTLSPSPSATSFTFPTRLTSGTNYAVQINATPSGLSCSVANGTGAVSTGDVSSIAIICLPVETVLYSFAGATDGASPYGSLTKSGDGNLYGVTHEGGSFDGGTVFKITPNGAMTTLYSFGGSTADGYMPIGNLLQGPDGNFYGMTNAGGLGLGVIFKITPDGTETVLHSFTTSEGYPQGSLIQGNDDNLYGMTAILTGGSQDLGTLFKITLDGSMTVLYSFGNHGSYIEFEPPQGSLAQDSEGNLYGATSIRYLDQSSIFKIALDGIRTGLYAFGTNANDGDNPADGLIQGRDGNFYGMTTAGGSEGYGTVFKMTTDGVETVLYSFGSNAKDGAYPYGKLIQGDNGYLYGMTKEGGKHGFGTVFKITPDGSETVLYSFGSSSGDGLSPQGSLIQGGDGNLYGMTSGGGSYHLGTVFKVLLAK